MNQRFPNFVKKRIPPAGESAKVLSVIQEGSLHTVCQSAKCPNALECFSKGVATFMILGSICTRSCTFCSVEKGIPSPLDSNEPLKVAEAAKKLNLKHVVLTSVTRDDLEDGGADGFRKCVLKIKELLPSSTVEILTPDFNGNVKSIETALSANPDVFNHNIETVPHLYPKIRPQADYRCSLDVLKSASNIITKSGLMVGLGETKEEILSVMDDLRDVGCDIITIGQYLSPTKESYPVVEFIRPEVFDFYKEAASEKGFEAAACGTFVRSSYMAEELLNYTIGVN